MAQWFQAIVLFTQKELRMWKELKESTSRPSACGTATASASDGDETDGSARLLFMKHLDKPMTVSFQKTMKETVGVIALYGLRKHCPVYTNHCMCLVGFALVHEDTILQTIVQKRRLPMRTLNMSMGFISHTDIIMAQRVGMSPDLQTHIHVSAMHGHVLDKTVAHGVYLSERAIGNHLQNWAVQVASPLYLWIMLRYTLAGFGGTNCSLLPAICLEQLAVSGIPPEGDSSPAYLDASDTTNTTRRLLAVECTVSSERYFQEFVHYIQHDYEPSIKKIQEIETLMSKQDEEWERFPIMYTDRSRELWATLSELHSLSVANVEAFLRDRFIPTHNKLFCKTPYEFALEQASVTVQPVVDFCLYRWGSGHDDGHVVNVHWGRVCNRTGHCKGQLRALLDGPCPLLCPNPELSVFAFLRQPLFMDSSDTMHHAYPYIRDSLSLTTIPSVASIVALLVGRDCLSSLMNGRGTLGPQKSCIHEVVNPLLNMSMVVVDVDVEAGSRVICHVRESEENLDQFCSELIENSKRVLQHLEHKCSSLAGLSTEAKHMVFRTEPGGRGKEGFHHLIVFPEWVCLQNIRVASAFVKLMEITRHCMPVVGMQGVKFDNIYESGRHAMRMPFQCKSTGINPLLLLYSDYGEQFDVSTHLGSLFMHGPKQQSLMSESKGRRATRLLIDDISGVNSMSESSQHYMHAVSVLSQRNKFEAQQSSFPSILGRFGGDLKCTSTEDIITILEKALKKSIAKKLVDKVNAMSILNTLYLEDIKFGWLADKEIMAVGKGQKLYMDVCIAQRHQGLQSCSYYMCIQRQKPQNGGGIQALLYEMCFSTNCIAGKNNPPYYTGISAMLS